MTVEYTVDVVEDAALLSAASQAWAAPNGPARYVRFDDDSTISYAPPEELTQVSLTPPAAISLLLSQVPYPAIPSVRFTSSGINPRGSNCRTTDVAPAQLIWRDARCPPEECMGPTAARPHLYCLIDAFRGCVKATAEVPGQVF